MTTWVHGEAATRQIAAMTARLTGHGDTSPSEQPDERWLSGSDSDRAADRNDERSDRALWGGAA